MNLLKGVSGKEAVNAFVKACGTIRTGNGDHVNINTPNGQLIILPTSGDVKIGLLKSAIRKEEMDDEEFLTHLKAPTEEFLFIGRVRVEQLIDDFSENDGDNH